MSRSWAPPGLPRPAERSREVTGDDLWLVMYSSGTTGRPKGVMLSHRNIVAHTQNAVQVAPMGPGDRNLVAMPLFHVGGTCYALFGIYAGVPSTFTREPDPASLLAAFAAGVTHAFVVPAVVSALLAAGEQAIAVLSGLKYLLYGAAPMPLPVLRQALATWPGLNFIQVYGQTELAGVISALSPQAHRDAAHQDRLGSAGTLLAGAQGRGGGPGSRPGRGGRPAGRVLVPVGPADDGLPEQAGRRRPGHHGRRLAAQRRHRAPRRRGVPVHLRPDQGHDHRGRRERLLARSRAGEGRASGGGRGRGDRHSR